MLGFTRRLSLAIPVRLTKMALKPDAPAPRTYKFFDEKNVKSLGLRLKPRLALISRWNLRRMFFFNTRERTNPDMSLRGVMAILNP